MKIVIARDNSKRNIVTIKDYNDIDDRGELAHVLCELKIIEQELLEMWEDYTDG